MGSVVPLFYRCLSPYKEKRQCYFSTGNKQSESTTILLADTRSSHSKVFCKKGVLENFANFTGQLYQKRDSDKGVSLCILRSFQAHLFYKTPLVADSVIPLWCMTCKQECSQKRWH